MTALENAGGCGSDVDIGEAAACEGIEGIVIASPRRGPVRPGWPGEVLNRMDGVTHGVPRDVDALRGRDCEESHDRGREGE